MRNTPDLEDFHLPRPIPELKEGREHLVVYLGIMGPQDGVDLLLESISYLVKEKQRRDTFFALIGPGTEQPRLKSLAAQRGLEPWVKFTGPLYGDELRAYLSTADVAVAPDPYNEFNDKATMVKVLEYQASGLPIVMYDLVEGRRSAGESALYARRNDPLHFGEQIAKLLDSDSLRRKLGTNGRSRIEAGLNWHFDKRMLWKAYEAALR